MRRGELETDGVRARCHECGEWFDHLGHHVRTTHGMSCDEYRDAWGLSRKTGLIGPRLREMRVKAAKERDEELRRRFLESRPVHRGMPSGFRHREETRRNRERRYLERTARRRLLQQFLRQLKAMIPIGDRISLARGWRWERTCPVCGESFILRRWSKRKACSRECWIEGKRRRALSMNVSKRPEVRRKISDAAKLREIDRDAKGRIVGMRSGVRQ